MPPFFDLFKPLLTAMSIGEKVEYVSQHAAVSFEYLGIPASGAGHGREAPSLNVEYLAPESTSSPELPGFILAI